MADLRWLKDVERRLEPGGRVLWWEILSAEIAGAVRGLDRPVVVDAGC